MTLRTNKSVELYVKQLNQLMEEAENGDLRVKGVIHTKNELGALTIKFNSFIEKIRILLAETKSMSNLVVGSSEYVLGSSAEEQVEAINNISSSIKNMSVKINDLDEILSKYKLE